MTSLPSLIRLSAVSMDIRQIKPESFTASRDSDCRSTS